MYWWQKMNELGKSKTPFLFLLDYELKQPIVKELSKVDAGELLFAVGEQDNIPVQGSITSLPQSFHFRRFPLDYGTYTRGFDLVLREIQAGNTFLLNYTVRTPVETNLSLDQIFHATQAKYRISLKNRFVCFSPEIFVRINSNGIISSNPMKGTIDASWPDAEKTLLEDPKELAEHYTIVDLIRNDLSIVASDIQVEQFRYIDRLKTNRKELLQASSLITGQLAPDWESRIGSIFKALLPAGSISGAPKKMTRAIIAEAEGQKRGYYTGICGVFNGSTVDSGVMIRFIEQSRKRLYFRSGGGITYLSQIEEEYQECMDKVYLPIRAELLKNEKG